VLRAIAAESAISVFLNMFVSLGQTGFGCPYFEASCRAGHERKPPAVTHRRLQNAWIIPGGRWPMRYSRQLLDEHIEKTNRE
jgi:hypothetical protein